MRSHRVLTIIALAATIQGLVFPGINETACTPGEDCPVWCRDGEKPKEKGCRPISTQKDFAFNSK